MDESSESEPGDRGPSTRPGKAGGKRERNRRLRIDALRQAGLALFLERGIQQVSIDEIAREAGTAKGNFYRYFRDKSELVEAILEPLATPMREALEICGEALAAAADEASLTAAYADLGMRFSSLAIGQLDVLRLYLQERRGPSSPAREGLIRLAREVDREAIELTRYSLEHGLLDVSDPRISALAVIGAAEHLALRMLAGELEDLSPQQVTETVVRMVLDGIRSR
ncbi:MAG: TetR/AcrR family transcriptional regulator [Myxococcales bacterium]|nr:TetR/AcrR family transcriptional regulator [Myxococcales bacterium]